MRLGLLFPGQGIQHAAMLPWLDENSAVMAQLHARLGADWRDKLHDPAWATRNTNAQVLLTATCLGAWAQLQPLLPQPQAVAGYSVGELSAICAAGILDSTQAIELAQQRATIMDACVVGRETGLFAVAGLSDEQTRQLCQQHHLYPAIEIGVGSVVLGGSLQALIAAQDQIVALGGTPKQIAVSLASHTPLLADGVAAMTAMLQPMPLIPPTITAIFNATGQPAFALDSIRAAIAQQIAQTLRWDACMDAMREQGVSCVLEIGPGATLSKLWNARFPDIPARSADEFRQAQGVVDWVLSQRLR